MEICYSCGEPARFEIADLCLDTREIFLDACCEENLDGWLDAIRSTSSKERASGCRHTTARRHRRTRLDLASVIPPRLRCNALNDLDIIVVTQ